MNDLITLGLACVAGFAAGIVAAARLLRPNRSQVEVMNRNIALTILAGEAVRRMNPEQRDLLEDEVGDLLDAAFGDAGIKLNGAGIEVHYDE